jgi:hypothetical protein
MPLPAPGRVAAVLVCALALAACLERPGPDLADATALAESERCRLLFATIAEAVEDAGTGDAEAAKVAGFPYLRVDRFLASFAAETGDGEAFAAWVERLAALGGAGLRVEIGNLPAAARRTLAETSRRLSGHEPVAALDACTETLRAADLAGADARQALREAAAVPDHYSDWQRVLGLYPLTAAPVALGYARWKEINLAPFRADPRSLPVAGRLVAFRPPAPGGALPAEEVAALLARARDNPLGIPEPAPAEAARLVAAFAPIWVVDVAGDDDRIGALGWRDGRIAVDVGRPIIHHRLSHARFGGEVLLQISYLAWFPARPRRGPLDLLGGDLDGVIWRVTLDGDGRPLVYDTIHACGCYHLFFPAKPLVRRPGPPHDIQERAEAPAAAPALAPGERIVVRLASTSHYVQGVAKSGAVAWAEDEVRTALVPADHLRARAFGDGETRSIYGPDGLVAGSERLERLLLWPMGVASAGAMRQWGTHATAFVGRRHFDDPYLLESAFRRAGR